MIIQLFWAPQCHNYLNGEQDFSNTTEPDESVELEKVEGENQLTGIRGIFQNPQYNPLRE
jgi:hypothetical protein